MTAHVPFEAGRRDRQFHLLAPSPGVFVDAGFLKCQRSSGVRSSPTATRGPAAFGAVLRFAQVVNRMHYRVNWAEVARLADHVPTVGVAFGASRL